MWATQESNLGLFGRGFWPQRTVLTTIRVALNLMDVLVGIATLLLDWRFLSTLFPVLTPLRWRQKVGQMDRHSFLAHQTVHITRGY